MKKNSAPRDFRIPGYTALEVDDDGGEKDGDDDVNA